jgi:hypothetical protein
LTKKKWVALFCFLVYYAILLSIIVFTHLPAEKPAEYVETYRGWIIIKVQDSFHPPAGYHKWYYIACKNETVILGVDLPDLIADINEAERR